MSESFQVILIELGIDLSATTVQCVTSEGGNCDAFGTVRQLPTFDAIYQQKPKLHIVFYGLR
jgi:hypothetical protein